MLILFMVFLFRGATQDLFDLRARKKYLIELLIINGSVGVGEFGIRPPLPTPHFPLPKFKF